MQGYELNVSKGFMPPKEAMDTLLEIDENKRESKDPGGA